jgi:hypothetical protein
MLPRNARKRAREIIAGQIGEQKITARSRRQKIMRIAISEPKQIENKIKCERGVKVFNSSVEKRVEKNS